MENFEYITLTKEQYWNLIHGNKYKIDHLATENAKLKDTIKELKKVNPKDYTIKVYNDTIYYLTNEQMVEKLQIEVTRHKGYSAECMSQLSDLNRELREKEETIYRLKSAISQFKKLSWFKKLLFKFD